MAEPTQDSANGNPSLGAQGAFGQVPIEITVSVGHARPLVSELLGLGKDAILPLDRRIDDPVELYVGDKLIAKGVLIEAEGEDSGRLAVRLTEVSDLDRGL